MVQLRRPQQGALCTSPHSNNGLHPSPFRNALASTHCRYASQHFQRQCRDSRPSLTHRNRERARRKITAVMTAMVEWWVSLLSPLARGRICNNITKVQRARKRSIGVTDVTHYGHRQNDLRCSFIECSSRQGEHSHTARSVTSYHHSLLVPLKSRPSADVRQPKRLPKTRQIKMLVKS
ncbi:hypothetical protein IQ06DRAFT_27016 [Phaeosphaeriaceae sp. SRC1lsM3a]|nr:hypothetical protein IQ06DRAFT_27016 [Stagonospora sp. SRC1lsM3a]